MIVNTGPVHNGYDGEGGNEIGDKHWARITIMVMIMLMMTMMTMMMVIMMAMVMMTSMMTMMMTTRTCGGQRQ